MPTDEMKAWLAKLDAKLGTNFKAGVAAGAVKAQQGNPAPPVSGKQAAAGPVAQAKPANPVTAKQAAVAQAKAEKKHGEVEKKLGNKPVDVSMIVQGVYGPVGGLEIRAIATADQGSNAGEIGAVKFKGAAGGGLYLAPRSWLPPGGMMEFSVTAKGKHVQFSQIHYPCPQKGILRLKAVERSKKATVSKNRTLGTTSGKSGTFEGGLDAGWVNSGASATWSSEHSLEDSVGVSEDTEESSGVFDVTLDM